MYFSEILQANNYFPQNNLFQFKVSTIISEKNIYSMCHINGAALNDEKKLVLTEMNFVQILAEKGNTHLEAPSID